MDLTRTTYSIVCMCDDCQAFAHWLGRADALLDEHGGTLIVQTTPSRVKIVQGSDQIRSVRLSSKGLHRWYSDCCKTPLGNTMTYGVPFVGMPHLCMENANALPIAARIHGRSCQGQMPRTSGGSLHGP